MSNFENPASTIQNHQLEISISIFNSAGLYCAVIPFSIITVLTVISSGPNAERKSANNRHRIAGIYLGVLKTLHNGGYRNNCLRKS